MFAPGGSSTSRIVTIVGLALVGLLTMSATALASATKVDETLTPDNTYKVTVKDAPNNPNSIYAFYSYSAVYDEYYIDVTVTSGSIATTSCSPQNPQHVICYDYPDFGYTLKSLSINAGVAADYVQIDSDQPQPLPLKFKINAGDGTDYVDASPGNDNVKGGEGNDTLFGWLGNDKIHGGTGDDFIEGREGDDKLYGDAGTDLIGGQSGNDMITGGDGLDSLYGDAGFDHLYAQDAGPDNVVDCGPDGDPPAEYDLGDDTPVNCNDA